MNKILTKVTAFCVGLAMVAGVGFAVGSKKVSAAHADDTITFTTTSSEISATGTNKSLTVDGVTLTFSNVTGVNASWIQNAKNATITSSEITGEIKSIKIYNCQTTSAKTDGAFTVYGGVSASAINTEIEAITGLSSTAVDKTIEFDSGFNYFKIVVGSARVLKHSQIDVVYGEASSATLESIAVTGSMTKTAYTTAESWDPTGFVVTAYYDDESSKDVTSSASWTYSPVSPTVTTTSVVATATYGEKSASSTAQNVTVTRANGIQALYSKSKGDSSGEFYGYYVGFATGSGPIVMDGEYGMMLYNSSQDVSTWTEGVTILHVKTGTIDVYSGLYEVKSYTVEEVASADIETPIVHTTTGNEVATEANRLTNATGFVATEPSKGSFTGDPGASDIQFTYTVGTKTFTVYYKKAAQTSEVMATLKDSLDNGTEITIKGFTSWYNAFQVTMTGLVEAVVTYTAEDFAQDLLDQTDAVCAGYEEGDNNHDALVAIWSNLASADKYPSLPSDQKTILAEAERDESGTVVEQAMARYDFLTGKYSLSNFINGRTPIVPAGSYVPSYENNLSSSSSITIIVIVAVASMTLLGVTLVIRKRKMN